MKFKWAPIIWVLWSGGYWGFFSVQNCLSLKWTGCSPTFISPSYLCRCMWALVLWWAVLVYLLFSLIPPHLYLYRCSLTDFLTSSFLPLSDSHAKMLQLSGCLEVLPGWYITVVHVGCHHHSSSSSVALETQEPNGSLLFQARMTFQQLNHTEFTFLCSFSFPAMRSYKFSSPFLIKLK